MRGRRGEFFGRRRLALFVFSLPLIALSSVARGLPAPPPASTLAVAHPEKLRGCRWDGATLLVDLPCALRLARENAFEILDQETNLKGRGTAIPSGVTWTLSLRSTGEIRRAAEKAAYQDPLDRVES